MALLGQRQSADRSWREGWDAGGIRDPLVWAEGGGGAGNCARGSLKRYGANDSNIISITQHEQRGTSGTTPVHLLAMEGQCTCTGRK